MTVKDSERKKLLEDLADVGHESIRLKKQWKNYKARAVRLADRANRNGITLAEAARVSGLSYPTIVKEINKLRGAK